MYRCTDCGQEYEIKPEYCDCGNNTFEEILQKEDNLSSSSSSSSSSTVQTELPVEIKEKEKEKEIKKFINSKSTNTSVQDKISLVIFIICIILSIFVILFVGNDNSSQETAPKQNVVKNKKAVTNNIPAINEIWTEKKTEKSAPPVQISPVQNVQNYVQKTNTTSTVKTIPVQTAKPKQTAIKSTQSSKQKNNIQTPVNQNKKTSSKPVTQPNTAQLQQELLSYKIALRNKIAAKINFASVVGDGGCVVSFKIDASGNLVNRTFSKQSVNESLNDAVYAAMMQTPTFKTPPVAYRNETLKLSVKMYGGNFEVNIN